ncbi:MAG: TonB-dependent receptor, partial [Erythrobacter sp.]|nr:TonB-dependent receptor [Erythrobacter sp.]
GPQGTLFGQSVSAGVINITTIAPDVDEFSGRISTELSFDDFAGSNYGKQQIRGALNLPIAGVAGLRLSGYTNWTQGVLENIYQGNEDYRDEWGIRGRLLINASDHVTINLAAEYNSENRGNGYFLTIRDTGLMNPVTGALTPAPLLANQTLTNAERVRYCGLNPNIDNFEICSDSVSLQTYRTQGYSGQVDIDLGAGLSLTSITAYRELNTTTQNDIDNLPEALDLTSVHSGLTSDYDQFTQEMRLASDPSAPLSFTLGAFYFKNHVNSIAGPAAGAATRIYTRKGSLPVTTCFPVSTNALCNTFITPGALNNYQTWSTENSSLFGELRYVTGQLTVFAGGRFNDANVAFHGETQNANTGAINAVPTNPLYINPVDLVLHDRNFSWRVGTEYEINPDVMIFATVARGYKNAQIAPLQNTTPATPVDPEIPTSYELGIKSSWLNGRLLANVSAFWTDVQGYQSSRCYIDAGTSTTNCDPFNLPNVTSKGIEADIFGRIGSNLTLNLSMTYNIVRYPNNTLAQDGVTYLDGMQLSDAPRFSASLYTDYNFPLTATIDGFLGFDVSYKSEERLSDYSANDYFVDQSRTIVGVRVGAEVSDSWRLAFFVNNLFNENSPQQFGTLVAQDGSRPTDPQRVWGVYNTSRGLRQVGLQASFQF